MKDEFKTSLADDILNGAQEIADFMGFTPRQVYHLAKTKQIPIIRFGNKIVGRKSALRAHIEKLEGAAIG